MPTDTSGPFPSTCTPVSNTGISRLAGDAGDWHSPATVLLHQESRMPPVPDALVNAGAVAIRAAVASRRISALQVAEAAILRIETGEPVLHAWQSFEAAAARAQASDLDVQLAGGTPAGLLAGVPLGVKDLFDTVRWPTAYGSTIYQGHRPSADADVVAAARAAGAVVMGKTVTTEFGYFQPGPTTNPWHPRHTPGGSSSGSAAAVAAGMVPLAFGTQTAGSLIRPASYCGVYALKPTFGRFSLQGVKGLSHSLDTLGWLGRDVDDLELMRCALAGEAFRPVTAKRSLRLAACRTHEWSLIAPDGALAWDQAHQRLSDIGLSPHPFELPEALVGLFEAQKTVMAYEAARTLASELAQHGAQLSQPLVQLLRTGLTLSDENYHRAQALARQGRDWIGAHMAEWDALIVPAAPGEAPAGLAATGDPAFSRVWTLLGLPCINVPGLRGPNGLPIGLQLVGHAGRERALLEAAQEVGRALSPR